MAKEKVIHASAPGVVHVRRNKKPVEIPVEEPFVVETPAPVIEELPYALKEIPDEELEEDDVEDEEEDDEHDPA